MHLELGVLDRIMFRRLVQMSTGFCTYAVKGFLGESRPPDLGKRVPVVVCHTRHINLERLWRRWGGLAETFRRVRAVVEINMDVENQSGITKPVSIQHQPTQR